MRLRKPDLHRRINADLQVEFCEQELTSFSGLELFSRYFRIIGLNNRLRQAFRAHDLKGDYAVTDLVLVLFALWLTGGSRLRHIRYLAGDPLVERLSNLSSLPSERTLSRWLGRFTNDSLQALISLNSELVLEKLEAMALTTVTLDFDGTVLSTGNRVQWAFRGYNPHNRHAKSYFPLLAHVAQTGHFLEVRNRPGNVHDARGGALEVIKHCVRQIREKLPGVRIEVRMDSAFFQAKILRYLAKNNIRYAVKVPMWKWLKLKETINARHRWYHRDEKLAWFKKAVHIEPWEHEVEMTFYREKLSDKPPKYYQLDLFTPDDGTYEYSVLCSNMKLQAPNLLDFYNGRCTMEHHIAELKGEFAFDSIPTRRYQANSAYQQTAILAYNLVRNFQVDTELTTERTRTSSRTNVLSFDSLKTLRFEWINVAGRLVNASGRKILRLNHNQTREQTFTDIAEALAKLRSTHRKRE